MRWLFLWITKIFTFSCQFFLFFEKWVNNYLKWLAILKSQYLPIQNIIPRKRVVLIISLANGIVMLVKNSWGGNSWNYCENKNNNHNKNRKQQYPIEHIVQIFRFMTSLLKEMDDSLARTIVSIFNTQVNKFSMITVIKLNFFFLVMI